MTSGDTHRVGPLTRSIILSFQGQTILLRLSDECEMESFLAVVQQVQLFGQCVASLLHL